VDELFIVSSLLFVPFFFLSIFFPLQSITHPSLPSFMPISLFSYFPSFNIIIHTLDSSSSSTTSPSFLSPTASHFEFFTFFLLFLSLSSFFFFVLYSCQPFCWAGGIGKGGEGRGGGKDGGG
jgi:hypothetical protein